MKYIIAKHEIIIKVETTKDIFPFLLSGCCPDLHHLSNSFLERMTTAEQFLVLIFHYIALLSNVPLKDSS